MSWTKALGALGLSGKGEPVQFEFTLYIRTLSPWPSNRPPRRLALRWTRGPKRHGNTRAVHPLYPDDDEPEDAPLTYEFKEQLHVPATLYKEKGGGGRGHAGFKAKALLLTLLEVDQSGRGADEVGTVSLNLADFANAGPGAQHERTLLISLKPGVSMGASGAPMLQMAVACRVAGSAAGPIATSSIADTDDTHDDEFDADEEVEDAYNHNAASPPESVALRADVPPPLPPRSPSPPLRQQSGLQQGYAGDSPYSAPPPASPVPPPRAASPPLPRSQSLPPPRSASPPLPPKPTYMQPQAAPQLPQRPPSPTRPASPMRPLPQVPQAPAPAPQVVAQPAPNPAAEAERDELAAEVERLRAELARSQEALEREAARSKQLSEQAAGAQLKYDLLVDMYTLQMLDHDILQAQVEGHEQPSYARGIAV